MDLRIGMILFELANYGHGNVIEVYRVTGLNEQHVRLAHLRSVLAADYAIPRYREPRSVTRQTAAWLMLPLAEQQARRSEVDRRIREALDR